MILEPSFMGSTHITKLPKMDTLEAQNNAHIKLTMGHPSQNAIIFPLIVRYAVLPANATFRKTPVILLLFH